MLKIGVLVSGGGTNLQAVIDKVHHQSGEIAVVIANKAEAYGLERAKKSGIATEILVEEDYESSGAFNIQMVKTLKDYGVELVVLAGYMKIITTEFVEAYPNRIVNIHPALIPSFCGEGYFGMHVHQAVIDYGVKITGATVHFVNEEADAGPIIAQQSVAVADEDTPESIQKKVLKIEHTLLPWVVEQYCYGNIHVEGRHVFIKNGGEK
ncbi:MAG: phosphoribosylglycinamide formyltransferase [Eubacterium sp.]